MTVGIAHYLFHASGRYAGRRCPADPFVDAEIRRQGVATAMIEWVAREAEEHGAPARALDDKVAEFHGGLIHYTYRPEANSDSGGWAVRIPCGGNGAAEIDTHCS